MNSSAQTKPTYPFKTHSNQNTISMKKNNIKYAGEHFKRTNKKHKGNRKRMHSRCMYFSTFSELCVYACISFALYKEIGFSDCT